ncbi:hypothetical protein HDU97_000376 [Phlyctochytrium planicorne]|nr:hypothetical protein HDU97_000376 [Phlyctochytrium planicorne]
MASSSLTSSFSDLFGGTDDIFAGLDAISATPSSPLGDDFLSFSLPGSARSSVILNPSDDSTANNNNASVASPAAQSYKPLSYSSPTTTAATPSTSTTKTSSPPSSISLSLEKPGILGSSGGNASSPRSSIQFPRFGSLSRTGSTPLPPSSPRDVPASPSSPPPLPPTRSSTKSVVASSAVGITGGSAAAAAAITGKPNSPPSSAPGSPSPSLPRTTPARPPLPSTPPLSPAQQPTASAPSQQPEDPQPAKKPTNAGQIINARSLVEDSDTASSVGSAGFVPTAAAAIAGGVGVTGIGSSASSSDYENVTPLARGRVPGSSKNGARGRQTRPTPSNAIESTPVRDANKAMAFENLLTSSSTVKLSSTPDRLRTLEVQGARKSSTISVAGSTAPTPRYTAKEATVNLKEDHGLVEFLKTTGPEDVKGGKILRNGTTGGAPLKGVLKTPTGTTPPVVPASMQKSLSTGNVSSSADKIAGAGSPSTPAVTSANGSTTNLTSTTTTTTATITSTDLTTSPPMSRNSTASAALPTAPPRATPPKPKAPAADESDSDDELFGIKKKKKDEMSLAEFLRYEPPPSSAAPAPAPVEKKKEKKNLFSLGGRNRERGEGSVSSTHSSSSSIGVSNDHSPSHSAPSTVPATPQQQRKSRTTSDASSTGAVTDLGVDDSQSFGNNRARSASQSSMERLVKSMFSGFGGGEDDDKSGGASERPPVPAIPPAILAKHGSQAGTKIEVGKETKELAKEATTPTAVAATTLAVKDVPVKEKIVVVLPPSWEKPLDAKVVEFGKRISSTSKEVGERFGEVQKVLALVDPALGKALESVDTTFALPDMPDSVPMPFDRTSSSCQTDVLERGVTMQRLEDVVVEGETVRRYRRTEGDEEEMVEMRDMAAQTIYDVLVVEYEEYLGDEELEEEEEEGGEVVVVEEESEEEGPIEDAPAVEIQTHSETEGTQTVTVEPEEEDRTPTIAAVGGVEKTPEFEDAVETMHPSDDGVTTPTAFVTNETVAEAAGPSSPVLYITVETTHHDPELASPTTPTSESDPRRVSTALTMRTNSPTSDNSDTALDTAGLQETCPHCAGKSKLEFAETRDAWIQTVPLEHKSEVGVQVNTLPVVPMVMSPAYENRTLSGIISPTMSAQLQMHLRQHPYGPNRHSLPPMMMMGANIEDESSSFQQEADEEPATLPRVNKSHVSHATHMSISTSTSTDDDTDLETRSMVTPVPDAPSTSSDAALVTALAVSEGKASTLAQRVRELEEENERLRRLLVGEVDKRKGVVEVLVEVGERVVRREVEVREEVEGVRNKAGVVAGSKK